MGCVKVVFLWEDEGCAGVYLILCDCGYEYVDRPESFESLHAEDGGEWRCPKCGKKIRWVWKGMDFEEVSDGED
jgi:DNA-directed RNA polymerase subunit RPC12/RpoP